MRWAARFALEVTPPPTLEDGQLLLAALAALPSRRDEAAATVALLSFERFTKNVSSSSTCVSPLTVTVTVFVVSPGANVSVPLAAR